MGEFSNFSYTCLRSDLILLSYCVYAFYFHVDCLSCIGDIQRGGNVIHQSPMLECYDVPTPVQCQHDPSDGLLMRNAELHNK